MRPLAFLLAASLLGGVLAGCVQPVTPAATGASLLDPALRAPLTEPIYEILGHFEHAFTGTTGTKLYVDYFLPDVPEGHQVPVILVFTPYQSGGADEVVPVLPPQAYSSRLVNEYVPYGYAVAFADVRGNHRAGGCIDQTGPEQWQDGYDYVEWLGTQEWSNGKVGMWGVSYDAETQFTTAMTRPPHLVTIVPIASVSNQYEWSFYQGVPYEGQPFQGMFSYFTGSAEPSTDPRDALIYHEKLECQPEQFRAGLDFSGDMTPFWKERDYRPMAKDIEASVLHVHGLADWNVRPIHVDPLFNDIQSEKRAIFGQWRHALPDREDWEDILHAWYDHWLLGRENGILDILPPVLLEDDAEQWHGTTSFPPLAQEWLTLELSADGTLVEPGSAKAGEVVLMDRPREVLRSVVPRGALAPDEAVFEMTTTEDMLLLGRPEITFTATSSARSTHWVARLVVVEKDCELNGSGQSVCDNAGFQDTRHREGLDRPRDLEPGEAYALSIRMYPQADVVPKGSTLRLVLANDDPNVQQDTSRSTNTVMLGGETPALLKLPLAPATILLPHDELPPVYPGYLQG